MIETKITPGYNDSETLWMSAVVTFSTAQEENFSKALITYSDPGAALCILYPDCKLTEKNI